jgi:small subunit ribosomal protein S8
MLTRIRNATAVRHKTVLVPASKMLSGIAQILKNEGFIKDFEVVRGSTPVHKQLRIVLSYRDSKTPVIQGAKRVSRPGLRVYAQHAELPRVYGGLGIAILSTPKGLLTNQQAWREHVGGEVLCYVW